MQASDIPQKIPVPFGSNAGAGNITYPIPTPPQSGGRASLNQGFPPITFTPVAAGGIPPFGQDENGILYWISAWSRWTQAGGGVPVYDSTFQTDIGGYPINSFIQSATTPGSFYLSTADNNVTNPDTGGAGWNTLASYVLHNAALTGIPTAPTAIVDSSNTQVANTFYADRSATNAANIAISVVESYVAANFLPLIGGTLSGSLTIAQVGVASRLFITGNNGFLRTIDFETNGGTRARFGLNTTAEGGGPSNVGSDVFLALFDNSANFLGNAFLITRATQVVGFVQSPTVPNLSASDNSENVPNTAYVDNQALVNNVGPLQNRSLNGVTIGASFNRTISTSTFTTPCAGTITGIAWLNLGGVGANNINCSLVLTVNGNPNTVDADNTPLPQFHSNSQTVLKGRTVQASVVVTTTSSPGVIGTYGVELIWTPTT